MNPAVSSVKKKDIFTNNCYNERDVVGDIEKLSLDACDPELAMLITKLLPQINKNTKAHEVIDQYSLAFYMSCVTNAKLKWRNYVVRPRDVFSVFNLPDIGQNIRNILCNQVQHDTMTKMLFFSLPFLKHNRLNLQPMSEISMVNLQHFVRIILGCYLGILQPNGKTPPWILRIKIIVFTMQLLSRGTQKDLYTFCASHQATLRIACIEYFIYFLQSYMIPELSMFACIFIKSQNTDALQFKELLHVINNFRVACYTSTTLDTVDFNSKALCMLERCNRICVTKLKHNSVAAPQTLIVSDKVIATFMGSSRTLSAVIAQTIHPNFTDPEIDQFMQLQQKITRYPLPSELQKIQILALQDTAKINSIKATNCISCHVCIRCGLSAGSMDTKMRLTSNGDSICSQCKTDDFVTRIFVIGHVVRCGPCMLFWCPICRIVHEWQASGYDFRACSILKIHRIRPNVSCFMCHKQVGLETVQVLDSRLGVLHTLSLCYKHRPWEFQTKWIHDIESFCLALKYKKRNKNIY